ncbi:hypothetical protein ACFYVR_04965 [Rhodococcus sp. NPDC003318]|uniref:hypothetical protein n=1 Tax=Rhodococcus sp. NPDC003318 TaxID=3364503 RepID=UPI0036882D6A
MADTASCAAVAAAATLAAAARSASAAASEPEPPDAVGSTVIDALLDRRSARLRLHREP